MVHAPRVLGFPKRNFKSVQAEIPTAALASGRQDAREFCHRNLWLSDGPAAESRGGRKGRVHKHERIRLLVGWGGMDLMDFSVSNIYIYIYISVSKRLEMTKNSWAIWSVFLLHFRFTYALSIDGHQASEVTMISYHRNELVHTFCHLSLWDDESFFLSFGCLFVWIPSEKNSYIKHVCDLLSDVNPNFWKTSSNYLRKSDSTCWKHLGRGEEDPAFFQLLENHTEENLKLNLVAIWWWVHGRFPFSL